MEKLSESEKLGMEQLKSDLRQKQPHKLYLFYGEEDYLLRYYLERLKNLVLDDLTADFNFHLLTAENYSLELLSDCMEALPMMADRSFILLEDVNLFDLREEERNKVAELLSDVPVHCCVVMTFAAFQPDRGKRKLWSVLEKNGILVNFVSQSESELKAWIGRHFKAHGKLISPQLCGYLLELCGTSMTRLNGEIEKLSAFSGSDTIVREDIDAVVEPTLDAVTYQLTDALGKRQFDLALERMAALQKRQVEPLLIVAAIGSQMRLLYGAKVLQKEGKGAGELAQIFGCRPFAASAAIGQAKHFSERFCEQAVRLCCETDHQLKSFAGNEDRLVELLVLQLAQEARLD